MPPMLPSVYKAGRYQKLTPSRKQLPTGGAVPDGRWGRGRGGTSTSARPTAATSRPAGSRSSTSSGSSFGIRHPQYKNLGSTSSRGSKSSGSGYYDARGGRSSFSSSPYKAASYYEQPTGSSSRSGYATPSTRKPSGMGARRNRPIPAVPKSGGDNTYDALNYGGSSRGGSKKGGVVSKVKGAGKSVASGGKSALGAAGQAAGRMAPALMMRQNNNQNVSTNVNTGGGGPPTQTDVLPPQERPPADDDDLAGVAGAGLKPVKKELYKIPGGGEVYNSLNDFNKSFQKNL